LTVLAGVTAFGELDDDATEALVSHGRRRELRSGEVLYTTGDPSTEIYVVLTGR
jgi:CRP-like cAMP-binding protein